MATPLFIAELRVLLQQLNSNISNVQKKCINTYAAQGVLQDIQKLLKNEDIREKREPDASTTRQEQPYSTRPRATQSEGEKKKAGSAIGESAGAKRNTNNESGLQQNQWSTVARKANREKPGNVQIQATPVKRKEKQQPNTQQKPRMEEPPIKYTITKESEWKPRLDMSPAELVKEIETKVGQPIAKRIMAIRIYQGGDMKVFPQAEMGPELRKGDEWAKKWLNSARPATRQYELVVSRVPTGLTAEQTAEILEEQNDLRYKGLELWKASWLGNPVGKRTLPLRVIVSDIETANRLIVNGLVLNYNVCTVSKFSRGRRRGGSSPIFKTSLSKTGEGTSESTITPENPRDLVLFSHIGHTAEDVRGRKRQASESTLERDQERGRRGRPTRASEFARELPKGSNPFEISKGQENTQLSQRMEIDLDN
ncbi:hypothetical protein A1O3_07792 [Capronia epimyces CBS 606.96]|uniref:DUF4780 domain-containing protein n=2 Tax=Capronia epimyces CBS 606.96 TaxID=1182542 RepID=W9YGU2_9EURO|nr:uncharacterized protein A1O3_07792 [Capronia epimyces CBS 606.96]EXJ81499.1 hypothetical protein A1O3_07792 [Capronia epimyces CBS 606.96]